MIVSYLTLPNIAEAIKFQTDLKLETKKQT